MQDYQFFLLVGLIVWALGLFKLIQAYYYYQQFKKARQDWPETLGTVTERKINQKVPPQTRQVPFWVEIKYSYTVIGEKINGLLIKRPDLFSTDALEKNFKEFPPGKRFMIRYNPEKPTMHITEYDKFIFDWAQMGFAFLWGTMLLYVGFKIPH
jgi:hypothetical protein